MTEKDTSLEQLTAELAKIKKDMHEALSVDSKSFIDALVEHLNEPESTELEPSLMDELEESATKFNVDHPRLSSILREIAEKLGNIGI